METDRQDRGPQAQELTTITFLRFLPVQQKAQENIPIGIWINIPIG
jgi:hypothetical protein